MGDIHCKISNIETVRKLGQKIQLLATERKFDTLILGGDILHDHEIVNASCLNVVVGLMRDFKPLFSQIVVLVGNHDLIHYSVAGTENHWLNVLKTEFTIVDKPTLIFPRVLAVPYFEPGKLKPTLFSWDPDWQTKVDLCFAHQELKGFKLGGIISDKGDDWFDDRKNPFIVSGHLHVAQYKGGNVLYSGSAFQHSFGDTSQGVFVSIQHPFPSPSLNREESQISFPLKTDPLSKSLFSFAKHFQGHELPPGVSVIATGMPLLDNVQFVLDETNDEKDHFFFNVDRLKKTLKKKWRHRDIPYMLRIIVSGSMDAVATIVTKSFKNEIELFVVDDLKIPHFRWKFVMHRSSPFFRTEKSISQKMAPPLCGENEEKNVDFQNSIMETLGLHDDASSNDDEDDDDDDDDSLSKKKNKELFPFRNRITRNLKKLELFQETDIFRNFSEEEVEFFRNVVQPFSKTSTLNSLKIAPP